MSQALSTTRRERDRVAWNLPLPSVATSPQEPLDWADFLARYFPDGQRHDLRALTAYDVYRREHAPDVSAPNGLGAWEDRGGATRVAPSP